MYIFYPCLICYVPIYAPFALERVRVGSGRGRFWGKEGLERRRIVLFVLGFLLARGSGFFESVCGRSVPAPEDWIFWKHGCSCREHDGAQKRTEEKVGFGLRGGGRMKKVAVRGVGKWKGFECQHVYGSCVYVRK